MVGKKRITFISRKKIEFIAHNHYLTKHAFKRLKERCGVFNIKQMILNSVFAWVNTDKTINIALDNYHYFVVVEVYGRYKIITYEEKSLNGYNVIDKFILAYIGVDRQIGRNRPNKDKGEFYD